MKTEIFVNPRFSYLSDYIQNIPANFNSIGYEIQKGRNEVRVVSDKDLKFVVKYFKRVTWVNRLIYATVRKSKAQRAYENSKCLLRKEITSPEPIAFMNIYKHGILYRSYYVSWFTYYKPLKELLALPIKESEEGLKAFARFTYRLHTAGILHDDFTIENVLYSDDENDYDFSLIDNNRMRFRSYSYKRGLRNLERLKVPVDKMGVIAAEYARAANKSDIRTLNVMVIFRLGYLIKVSIKQKLKAIKHSLAGKHKISLVKHNVIE